MCVRAFLCVWVCKCVCECAWLSVCVCMCVCESVYATYACMDVLATLVQLTSASGANRANVWVCLIECVYMYQACRVVRYGTVTVCTVRTVLVKLRRITVIVTPYFTVITVKYGTVYGTVPSGHCQCKNDLRMASSPQNLPFSPVCSSHVLTPHIASLNDPEAGLGLHQLGGWHCQCKNGLRKASLPQTPPISISSMLPLWADATQCVPERPWGWVSQLHQLGGRAQRWLAWTLKSRTQYLIHG